MGNGSSLSETSHVNWSTNRVFGAFATRDSFEFCDIGLLATQTKSVFVVRCPLTRHHGFVEMFHLM